MNLFKRSSAEDASLCVAERLGYGIGNTAMHFYDLDKKYDGIVKDLAEGRHACDNE